MSAKLFGAVFALEIFVCIFREALGVAAICNFPNKKNRKGKRHKHVVNNRTGLENKENKRCEHHWVIPIVNTAGVAAFVFHHPRLERAEEHNANQVANAIRK